MSPLSLRPIKFWITCSLSGILALMISLIIIDAFPDEGAGYAPGYGSPIYAFEFARSENDVRLVLGEPDTKEYRMHVDAMNYGNFLDNFFLLFYGSFITSFFLAVASSCQQRLWYLGVIFGAIAPIADILENQVLKRITTGENLSPEIFHQLSWWVNIKFISIAFAIIMFSFFLYKHTALLSKLLSLIILVCAALIFTALTLPDKIAWLMSITIGFSWIVKLSYSTTHIWRFVRNKKGIAYYGRVLH